MQRAVSFWLAWADGWCEGSRERCFRAIGARFWMVWMSEGEISGFLGRLGTYERSWGRGTFSWGMLYGPVLTQERIVERARDRGSPMAAKVHPA